MSGPYPVPSKVALQIENNFKYHSPQAGQPERYVLIRNAARDLATLIAENTPPSREQALAITNLEQVTFWANAAIARGENCQVASVPPALSEVVQALGDEPAPAMPYDPTSPPSDAIVQAESGPSAT